MAKQSPAVRKGRQLPEAPGSDILPFERGKRHRGANLQATANVRKRVEFLKEAQGQYYLSMKSSQITFAIGPAGTGKTHIATGLACEMLVDKEIDQIVVTRPMIGVDDEEIGALPGELEDKFDPYFAPLRTIMERFLGYGGLDAMLRAERIIVKPIPFIRGCTFDRSFVILDEAQNTTIKQMKAFLTRIGKYTTMAVNGDIEQIDLPPKYGMSGLVHAVDLFKTHPKFGFIEFDVDDIVREDLCKDIILAYRAQGK